MPNQKTMDPAQARKTVAAIRERNYKNMKAFTLLMTDGEKKAFHEGRECGLALTGFYAGLMTNAGMMPPEVIAVIDGSSQRATIDAIRDRNYDNMKALTQVMSPEEKAAFHEGREIGLMQGGFYEGLMTSAGMVQALGATTASEVMASPAGGSAREDAKSRQQGRKKK